MSKNQVTLTFAGDTKDLEKAFGRVGDGARGVDGKLETNAEKFGKWNKRAVVASTAVIGAVGAFAKTGVEKFLSFDDAMNQSTAIMGDLSDTMKNEMSDAAREVAKTTRFSAEEAAESYFYLASAGMDAEASLAALPQVAKFAQAGMFDMATATDLSTDAQSALGLTSEDAAENLDNLTRVTDVFVAANTLANASVEEFAAAMTSKAGGALRNLNKDVEEGTAVLSVFADSGIKGERAGTLLTNTLDGLTSNARDNASAFEALGVEVFNSEGEMNHMADIISDLEDGFEGMTTEQKDAELANLGFTKQSREGIKALLDNSDAIRDYDTQLRDASGTVDEISNNQLDSFAAKWDLVKSGVEDLQISIGEKLVPILTTVMEFIADNEDTVIKLATGLVALAGFVLAANIAFKAFRAVMILVRGAILAARAAQLLLNIAMRMNPIGLVITAIILLAVIVYKNFDKIKEFIGKAWDWIKDKSGKVWNWIKDTVSKLISSVRDKISSVTDRIKSTVKSGFNKVKEFIQKPIQAAREFVVKRVTGLVDFFKKIPSRIKSAISALANIIKAPFKTAFDAVKRIWNNTVGGFGFSVPSWVPGVGGKGFKIPRMHVGGVVPGSPGQERMAILQAGERVIPARQASGSTITLQSDGTRLGDLLIEVFSEAMRTNPEFRAQVRGA